MKRSLFLPSVIAALAAVSCTTTPSETTQDAILIEATVQTQNEITTIVKTALNGTPTIVSAARLTENSTLVIDPVGAGNPMTGGRIMGTPDHFDLKMTGKHCFLEHRQTGKTYALTTAKCRART